MSRIRAAFDKGTAFVAYITAGDPNIAATELYVWSLIESGVNILELGVPFSDPMADGPVNQRAAERALRNKIDLGDILDMVARLRASRVEIPIVLFTYFNPIFVMGVSEFASKAKAAGVDGVLTLDLPIEEAADYRRIMSAAGLDTVFLAAPTSGSGRLRQIDEASSGFVYYVSRTGVTGAQTELSDTLMSEMAKLKKHITKNPVAVGFGISKPEHVRAVAAVADGVVVGSAIVKLIEENTDPRRAAQAIKDFVKKLTSEIKRKT